MKNSQCDNAFIATQISFVFFFFTLNILILEVREFSKPKHTLDPSVCKKVKNHNIWRYMVWWTGGV